MVFRVSELPLTFADGAYRLLRILGSGGMGVVYEAEDLRNGFGRCAVKILLPHRERHTLRFINEWERMMELGGDHIIAVYGGGHDARHGLYYYAMEIADDALTVDEMVALPVPQKLALAGWAAVAIDDLHRQGVVHRDVKPANLVCRLTDVGIDVKLGDLGIAKDTSQTDGLTVTGELAGSLCYMAPEQMDQLDQATTASDVYALGATLYHLLTGRAPYQGLSQREQMLRVLKGYPPIPIEELTSGLPPELISLTRRMMAYDPAFRPANLREIDVVLCGMSAGLPIEFRPRGVGEGVTTWTCHEVLAEPLAEELSGPIRPNDELERGRERARARRRVMNRLALMRVRREAAREQESARARSEADRRAKQRARRMVARRRRLAEPTSARTGTSSSSRLARARASRPSLLRPLVRAVGLVLAGLMLVAAGALVRAAVF